MFETRGQGTKDFLFSTLLQNGPGRIQPPVQWVLEIKRPTHRLEYLSVPSAVVKDVRVYSCISTPLCAGTLCYGETIAFAKYCYDLTSKYKYQNISQWL